MKKLMIFLMICCLALGGCKNNSEIEEWDYEKLEEEFGGIIELDFESTKNCLDLIERNNYVVSGYIIEKTNSSILGLDLYYIKITDDMDNSYEGNEIDICVTKNDFFKVNEGDYIYASGKMQYTDYGGKESENSVSMSCHTGGNISLEPIENCVTVKDYIDTVKNISESTYFQTEGILIQDGEYSNGTPIYKLYESKEAYKENKYGYISIGFLEEQYNMDGKTVVIIGKPDTYLFQGLVKCSVLE